MSATGPVSTWLRLAGVDAVLADCPPDADWMTGSEQDRMPALRAPGRRRQFRAGHWLLRRLAADVLGHAPRDWRVEFEPDRAPKLLSPRGGSGGQFHASLSHSGDWVAAAIGRAPVGVDVECPTRARDWHALARTAFSPAEQEALAGLADMAARDCFVLHWTLKEAEAKRSGLGLRLDDARAWQPQACGAEEARLHSWALPQGALALATEAGAELGLSGLAQGQPARHWRVLAAT